MRSAFLVVRWRRVRQEMIAVSDTQQDHPVTSAIASRARFDLL
jgi:hypothetical protein